MLFPFSKLSDDELVARFVMVKRWIQSNQSVKHNAYMPPPDKELSVTRHKGISAKKLWRHGKAVAEERATTEKRDVRLLGRADVSVSDVRRQNIEAVPHPIWRKNWNHAHLIGWHSDEDKSQQIMKAKLIAAEAQYVPFEE